MLSQTFHSNVILHTQHRLNLIISLPRYRFTKELTQNVKLRTYLNLEYNIKSLNYIQKNYRFHACSYFIEL